MTDPLVLMDPTQFVMRMDLLLCRCGGCNCYLNWRHLTQDFPHMWASCCGLFYEGRTISPSLAMFEVQMGPAGGENVRSIGRLRKMRPAPAKAPA